MTAMRCAVLDDYQNVALDMADWSCLGDRLDVRTFHTRFETADALVRAIADCEIVVAMRERTRFPAALFERLPRLKLLVTTGMRNAAIDIAAARAHGVVVCGTGSRPEPPAELTWALILGLSRHLLAEASAFRANGPWQQSVGLDLYGRRLGLLGFGRIGTRVARVALAFGMQVSAWSEHLTRERTDAEGVELAASLNDILERSDIVSIHLVLGERTRGMIGSAELRRMRPDAFLINTSRSGIVEEAALVRALEEGWIAGAGLDVFDQEPVPADHPFRRLPNVLATPHLGYVTRANYETYYREAVEDIVAFLNGSPVRVLS